MTNRLRNLINKIRNFHKNGCLIPLILLMLFFGRMIFLGIVGGPPIPSACRPESEEWIKCGDHTLKKDAISGIVATEQHPLFGPIEDHHSEEWSIIIALKSGGEVTVWVDDIESSLKTFKELETNR